LLAGVAVGVIVVILMTRLAAVPAVRYPVIILACLLGVGPLGPLAVDVFEQSSPVELPAMDSSFTSSFDARPDIYLIVVDGFIGISGAREVFRQTDPPWVDGLAAADFEIPKAGWSSYPITIASVPSLMEMDYPVTEEMAGDRALFARLIEKLGGDNRLVHTLNDLGYETTMVEAGWSWSHCGGHYDVCVPSAFLDEGTFRVIGRSLAGPATTERFASAFTVGARHAMGWLLDDLWEGESRTEPRFVFGHVMAPHPPLFLDENCDVVFDLERAGVLLNNGFAEIEQRKDLYLSQAECVTSFMLDFASRAASDDVVVFVADHGSDSTNQLVRPGSEWTEEDSRERLSVLAAIRAGSCEFTEPIFLPNLMRAVLDCVAAEPPTPAVEDRMFAGQLKLGPEPSHFVELTEPEVAAITGAG
jgi:hypothetical protein